MRFHAIMLVRDEADVLAECMTSLLEWVDSLVVFDTGSDDGSWEIVQEFGSRDDRVIPWRRDRVCFEDSLRAHPFAEMRHRYEPGDWVGRVDADEFYPTPMPEFVREHVHPRENLVVGMLLDFILLPREARAIARGNEDLTRSIRARRRHFVLNTFPEPRWFRYRRGLGWPQWHGQPMFVGPSARERVPILHYRWRTPAQAHRRCALRSAVRPEMHRGGGHWKIEDWRKMGLKGVHRRAVHHWKAGDPVPRFELTNHLEPKWRQRAMWAISRSRLLWLADRFASGLDPAAPPRALPDELEARYRELKGTPVPGIDEWLADLEDGGLHEQPSGSTVPDARASGEDPSLGA